MSAPLPCLHSLGRWAVLAVACLALTSRAAEPLTSSMLLLTNVPTAPFPHDSRKDGHTYQGKAYPAAEHYSDSSVAIAFPRGYAPRGTVDFVVHFHGWYNNVTNTLQQFELMSQLEASGRQAVLVVPEGPRNAPDSSGGRLEEAGAFREFMDDVLRIVRSRLGSELRIGRITLSGHSGGYRVIGWILDRGGLDDAIREVFLFDAVYAQVDHFSAWAAREGRRLIMIYTDGGGTLKETANLKTRLRSRDVPFLEAEDPGASPQQLRGNRIVFLHTDLGHNDVVARRRHFEAFLRAGMPETGAVR